MADEQRPGVFLRLAETFAGRAGMAVERPERIELLEAEAVERRALSKEMEMLGWTVLDHVAGEEHEVRPEERRKMARQAEMVWIRDPQAGAAVDLYNDFTFGRGVPKPRAKDPEVQEVLDEVWDDSDNQLVLTRYASQVALGTTLSLTSNLFILFFEGEDGKIKLGLLDSDTVTNAVRHEENRLRVTYYLAAKREYEWDFENDRPKSKPLSMNGGKPQVLYYEHVTNVESLEEDGGTVVKPPASKLGTGRVYHVAVNRHSEQVFGVPTMRRLIKWFAAYNDFMAARVDVAQAAAAFVMKRKVKGTPDQLARMASKAISRQSPLASASASGVSESGDTLSGPRPGSILNENDLVSHENFALNTNSAQAQQDAQMIRAQISAGTRFPQAYYGDAANSSLATATSLELPILKAIEARQELFEGIFRTLFDRAIKLAVDKGKLTDTLSSEEIAKRTAKQAPSPGGVPAAPGAPVPLQEGYEGQGDDEAETQRDLSYEFSMPNPLKRVLADLTNSVANIARTFDPNNTNPELSRALLTIVLGEGLEVDDPAALVERIFPEGYVDPALAAAQAQQTQPPPGGERPNFFGPDAQGFDGADGQRHQEGNAYGAPGMTQMQQAAMLGRYELPREARVALRTRGEAIDDLWREDVQSVVADLLATGTTAADLRALANGNGNGHAG